jgi:hypothetical protein
MDGCTDLCKHALVNNALAIWCNVGPPASNSGGYPVTPYQRCTFVYHIDRSVVLKRPDFCPMRGKKIACDQTKEGRY